MTRREGSRKTVIRPRRNGVSSVSSEVLGLCPVGRCLSVESMGTFAVDIAHGWFPRYPLAASSGTAFMAYKVLYIRYFVGSIWKNHSTMLYGVSRLV